MIKNFLAFILCILALALVSCEQIEERGAENGYFFEANGVTFCVGDDAMAVADRLGTPNKSSRAPSCAGVGEDIVYVYSGFRVTAYSEQNKEKIVGIELTNDLFSTVEGVSIGTDSDAVRDIYGTPDSISGAMMEYKSGGVRLQFSISDGKVKAIKYLLCQ